MYYSNMIALNSFQLWCKLGDILPFCFSQPATLFVWVHSQVFFLWSKMQILVIKLPLYYKQQVMRTCDKISQIFVLNRLLPCLGCMFPQFCVKAILWFAIYLGFRLQHIHLNYISSFLTIPFGWASHHPFSAYTTFPPLY